MHATDRPSSRRLNPFVCALLAVTVLIGCGGRKTYSIKGKIVYEDDQSAAEDLVGYTVTLQSVEQSVSATGIVEPDGTFEVSTYEPGDGAVPGKHRVAVTPPIQETDGPPPKPLIHPRYASFDTSGLEIAVDKSGAEIVLSVQRVEP